MQELDERCLKEIEVLEEAEETEVDGKGKGKQQAALDNGLRAIDGQGAEEIYGRRDGDEDQEAPIPPAVKEIARREQEKVLRPVGKTPVDQDYQRQKYEVDGRIKKHASA